ncbi:MAG: 16S rRNA (guanine(966)-N(2))-methyltransferase RsmD [Flavobacteriia bacterium]|jgi:16S rRNA (guanine(966)-N(2))-methyltransferase RsmD|nr:16S rRNA (guanine(966)-N(2))-methyltransferase RsmD [Flavobacteriia bacterium]NBV67763.1 16S rRNA (guanine(966)-N(2))-methyltransferase RsmD [Flavobacteriia bacterium]NBV91859.1 16S rRNA (guanine(966)-N(2))-methyltransferase RsmD [Flavobacteriia bacterium]
MRIISGSLKSRNFQVPTGFPSRPTTNYAKEGLFNVLNNLVDFDELEVLDLCAGTGNLSFEFISRGAAFVSAVDKNPKACKWIQSNAQKLSIEKQMSVTFMDCLLFLTKSQKSFDIIIADPPYDLDIHKALVESIFTGNHLKKEGLCIIEHGKQTDLSKETNFQYTRKFGNVHFSFFQWV